MTESKPPKRFFTLTLRLLPDQMPTIDQAAQMLGMSRTDFIRLAINRSLNRFETVELPIILERLGRR